MLQYLNRSITKGSRPTTFQSPKLQSASNGTPCLIDISLPISNLALQFKDVTLSDYCLIDKHLLCLIDLSPLEIECQSLAFFADGKICRYRESTCAIFERFMKVTGVAHTDFINCMHDKERRGYSIPYTLGNFSYGPVSRYHYGNKSWFALHHILYMENCPVKANTTRLITGKAFDFVVGKGLHYMEKLLTNFSYHQSIYHQLYETLTNYLYVNPTNHTQSFGLKHQPDQFGYNHYFVSFKTFDHLLKRYTLNHWRSIPDDEIINETYYIKKQRFQNDLKT